MVRLLDRLSLYVFLLIVVAAYTIVFLNVVSARDLDGRWAQQDPAMHDWFNGLASGKGMCCSFADGKSIADVDWDTDGVANDENSGYRVRLDGVWHDVPNSAMVPDNNRYGPAVVWPYSDGTGGWLIRCFMPGTLS